MSAWAAFFFCVVLFAVFRLIGVIKSGDSWGRLTNDNHYQDAQLGALFNGAAFLIGCIALITLLIAVLE